MENYHNEFTCLLNAVQHMGNTEGDMHNVLVAVTKFYVKYAILCIYKNDKIIDQMISMLHVISLQDPAIVRETAKDFLA